MLRSVTAPDCFFGESQGKTWRRAGRFIMCVAATPAAAFARDRIPWTFLRPNFFTASFAVYMGTTIRTQSAFYAPAGGGRISMIDPRDIAACVLAAFTNSKHQLKAYDLTGPEALSLAEAAEKLSAAVGRNIDIVKAGLAAGISPAVEQIAGKKPRSLDDWARDNAASLR
jgi:uncharacterized protein YbjT (DUF2867 family)